MKLIIVLSVIFVALLALAGMFLAKSEAQSYATADASLDGIHRVLRDQLVPAVRDLAAGPVPTGWACTHAGACGPVPTGWTPPVEWGW